MKKSLSPIIRPLSEQDLMDVYHLDQLCYEPGIAYSLQTIFGFYYFLKLISYIAEVEGKVAGFIMTDLKKTKKAHIITLDIHPDFRRQAIGSQLLILTENEMKKKGIKSIFLEVDVDNEPAINLYEKFGYKKIKMLKNYYRRRKDAYRMEKELIQAE